MQRKKGIIIFTLLTILLTTGLAFLLRWLHMDSLSPFLMFIPFVISVFVQKLVFKKPIFKQGEFGFRLGQKRWLLYGPLFSLVFVLLSYTLSYLFNADLFSLQTTETVMKEKVATYSESYSLFINIVIAASVQILLAPLINILLYIGEEAGWRAFLYPNLVKVHGKFGLFYGGIIWGIWHAPMIYLYDLNYGKHHHLGLLFMIVFCVLLGIIMQYIYTKSGSVFSVALAHGMLNVAGGFIHSFVITDEYHYFLYGATGLIGLSLLLIGAIYCYRRFPNYS